MVQDALGNDALAVERLYIKKAQRSTVDWLGPLRERSEFDESMPFAKRAAGEGAEAHTGGSPGLLPVPAWPTCVRGRGGAPALPNPRSCWL